MINRWLTLSHLSLRDFLHLLHPNREARVHLQETIAWLCRAQDAAGGDGVARSYTLQFKRLHKRCGWQAAYPETTGYIIPTFFDYAAFADDKTLRARALRMAHWEVDVQMDCGAVQGGVIGFPPTPAVFNTGQVLFGWARAYRETGEEVFRQAASRAAGFLAGAQDADGAWRQHGSQYARLGVNVYDARTAWGLLEAFHITRQDPYRDAAVRNVEFVLTQQHPNGWFAHCCLDDDTRPILHTLAYTIEGLLEAGALLHEPRYIQAAQQAADALLAHQRPDGSLAGRFDAEWQPVAHWSCLPGDAQIARVWLRLFQLLGKLHYLKAAQRMTHFLASTQHLTAPDPGVRGGIKGAHPIWAEYAPYEYPNWAAKFFVDALLLQERLVGEATACQPS